LKLLFPTMVEEITLKAGEQRRGGVLGREVRLRQSSAVVDGSGDPHGAGLPNFPSYTSGHSTFSAAAAEVLSYLFPGGAADFDAQRDEAAISRLYGGIHSRSDIEVGKDHGKRVGGYTVRFAMQDGADPLPAPAAAPSLK